MILAVSNFSLISQPTGQQIACRSTDCDCSRDINRCTSLAQCKRLRPRNPELCNSLAFETAD